MSSRNIALVTIVISSLLWSTSGAVSKILLRELPPFPLAFLRFMIASLAILPWFLKQKHLKVSKLIRDILPLSLFSAANIMFFYIGLTKTTANAAALIYTATPIMAALLARVFTGEQLSKQKIQGVFLGLAGATVISILPLWETGTRVTGDLVGNLLILAAVFSWAIYTVGSKRIIAQGYSPVTITATSFFVSTIIFFFITITTFKGNLLMPFQDMTSLILLIHLAILVTVATYLLYQWAIKHSSATTASLNVYLQPVFGIIINAALLGESVTPGFIVGGILVGWGVLIATRGKQ